MEQLIIILCTLPHDEKIAITLAKRLIKKNLAACVTFFPNVHSIYSWNNKIEQQKEIQLLIKTHIKLEKSVFEYVKTKHPYQTPELLSLKIHDGHKDYISWIHNTLKQNIKLFSSKKIIKIK